MSATGVSLKSEADKLSKGANLLFESSDFETNRKKQCHAIIGMVASHVYDALGQLADGLVVESRSNKLSEAVRKKLDTNQLLRMAAANDNWTEFDRLVRELTEPAGPGPPVAPTPVEA